jgi:hypothetical protein
MLACTLALTGLALTGVLAVPTASLFAQTARGPEQDCFNALPVRQPIITQQLPYSGVGFFGGSSQLELRPVASTLGCSAGLEQNSVWYRIDVGANGNLGFTIRPNNNADEIDWVLFRVRTTAGVPDLNLSCAQIRIDGQSNLVACRLAPNNGGVSGLLDTISTFTQFGRRPAVQRGEVYLLYVGSAPTTPGTSEPPRAGYTLDFSNSSAGVIPNVPVAPKPSVSFVPVQNPRVDNCGQTSTIEVTFTQNVLCGTAQPSSFVFVGPQGFDSNGNPVNRQYTITGITSSLCNPQGNDPNPVFRNYADPHRFTFTVSPVIQQTGIYTLSTNANAPIPLRDVGNAPLVFAPIATQIVVGTERPTLSLSTPATPTTPAVPATALRNGARIDFCLGQSRTLQTANLGVGARYEWFRGPSSEPVRNLRGQLITTASLTVQSRYIDQRFDLDSTGYYQDVNTPETLYRVRVTDPGGCVRTSDSAFVVVTSVTTPAITVVRDTCSGFATLSVPREANAVSYQWYSNGNPDFSSPQTRTNSIQASDPGLYTLEIVYNNNCKNIAAPIVLAEFRIPALPLVVGPGVVCQGGAITLSLDPAQSARRTELYEALQWTRNGVNLPGATGTSIVVNDAGNYNLTARLVGRASCGFVAGSARSVTLSRTPPTPRITPSGGGSTSMMGGTKTATISCGVAAELITNFSATDLQMAGFTAQDVAGFTYEWRFNDVVIPSATSLSYRASAPGLYTVRAFNRDGCPSAGADSIRVIGGATPSPEITVRPGENPGPNVPVVRIESGSVTICSGQSATLDAGAGDAAGPFQLVAYNWTRAGQTTSLGTGRTLVVRDAGTYTVQVISNGCPGSSALTVIVQSPPMPRIAPDGNRTSFCVGDSLGLDAGVNPRTMRDFDAYVWTLMGDASTVLGRGRRYFAKAAGTYVVTVTDGACAGTGTSVPITVNGRPTVDSLISDNGIYGICPNGSLTLIAPAAPMGDVYMYQWRLNGVNIAAASGRTLSVTAAGSYNVLITNNAGCTNTAPRDRIITQFEAPIRPVIMGPAVLCPGTTIELTSSNNNYTSFQWLRDGQVIAGRTTSRLSVNQPGTYTVRVTNSNTCESLSSNFVVAASALTVRIDTTNFGLTFIAVSMPAATTYQWFNNGVAVTGATMQTINPQVGGSYSVRVTDINGCTATSSDPRQFILPTVSLVGTTGALPNNPSNPNPPAPNAQTVSAAPGDTLTFVVTFTNFGSLAPGAPITANLLFNATLLEPLPPLTGGTVTRGIRTIPVSFRLPSATGLSVQQLPFRAALGNDSTTAVRLDNVQTSTGIRLASSVGRFNLRNISYAGGARLIGPPPEVVLPGSRPNPASDDVTVSYELAHDNTLTAVVMDVRGNTIKTVELGALPAGKGEAYFSLADVPSGVYYVVFRTGSGERAATRVVVAR